MTTSTLDRTSTLPKGRTTTDLNGRTVTILSVDFQSKSVFLADGRRLGFARARKVLGLDL